MVADDNSRLAQPEAEQVGWTLFRPVNSFLQPGNVPGAVPDERTAFRPVEVKAEPACGVPGARRSSLAPTAAGRRSPVQAQK